MARMNLVAAIAAELREIEARGDALRQALKALGGQAVAATQRVVSGRKGRRKMSAAGRKAISRATKARWAAVRKAGKKKLG